jgi:hypothetical protein
MKNTNDTIKELRGNSQRRPLLLLDKEKMNPIQKAILALKGKFADTTSAIIKDLDVLIKQMEAIDWVKLRQEY